MAGESSIEELLFRIKVDPTQLDRLGPLVADELKEAAAAAQGFQVSDAAFQAMGAQMGAAVLRGLQGFLSGKGIDVSQLFTGDLARAVDPGKVRQLQEQLQQAGSRATQRAAVDPGGAQQEAQLNRLIQQRDQLARTRPIQANESVFADKSNPRQKIGVDILRALGEAGNLQPTLKRNGNFDQQTARQQLNGLRDNGLAELERQIQTLSTALQRQVPPRPAPAAPAPAPNAASAAPKPAATTPTPAAPQTQTGGAGGGQKPPVNPPTPSPAPQNPQPTPATPPPAFTPPTQATAGGPIKGATAGLNDAEIEQVLRNLGAPAVANGGEAFLRRLSSSNTVKEATGGLAGAAAGEARYGFSRDTGRGADYAALAAQITDEALSRQENEAAARRQASGLVDIKGNPIESEVQRTALAQAEMADATRLMGIAANEAAKSVSGLRGANADLERSATATTRALGSEASRLRANATQDAKEQLGLVQNNGLPFPSDVAQRALEGVRASENAALQRTAEQRATQQFDSRVGGADGLYDPAKLQTTADNNARAAEAQRLVSDAKTQALSLTPRDLEEYGQALAGNQERSQLAARAEKYARAGLISTSDPKLAAELPYAFARINAENERRQQSVIDDAARQRVTPLPDTTRTDIAEGKRLNAQDSGADARARGDYMRNGRVLPTYTDPALQAATDRLKDTTAADRGRRSGSVDIGVDDIFNRFQTSRFSAQQNALNNLARAQVQMLEQEVEIASRAGAIEQQKVQARLRLAEADARGLVSSSTGQFAVSKLTDEERRRGAANVLRQERDIANRNRAEDLRTYLDNPNIKPVDKAIALARNATPGTPPNEQRTVGQRFREGFLGDRQDPIETLGQTLKFSTFYGGAYLVLNQVQQAFTQAIGGALQYEDALRALNATTQNSSEENERLAESVTRVGQATGTGTAQSAATLQKTLGLYDLTQSDVNTQQTVAIPAVAVAQRLARLDGSDPSVAATQLAGVIRSFGLSNQSQSYVEDVATVVGKRSGTSAADLLTGTTQIGTLASAAGYDLPTTLALISRLTSTTGRSATDVAGNLSQVFSKADDPTASAKLAQYGVDTSGTTLAQQIQQLSGKGLDDRTLNQIAQSFGRGLSGAAFLNIVKNQDSINELATAGANADPGSGAKYFNEVFGKSISEQLNKLGIEFQSLVNTLVQSGLLGFLGVVIVGARAVVGAMNDVVSVFNLIPSPLRRLVVGFGELYLALRLLGALKLAGIGTSLVNSAAASRAGGILASLNGGAAAAGAVGTGAALRAGGGAALGLGRRAGSAIFGTVVGRASLVGGVVYGITDAQRETEDLNTTRRSAALTSAGASTGDEYRAAADAQRSVINASLEQQAFSVAHLSSLELAPLLNRLSGSNSARSQAAARTAQDYLSQRATELDAAQERANAADPANAFGQFSSTDQVTTAMSNLAAAGYTAQQSVDTLSRAFGTLVYKAQAGTDGIAAYVGTAQGTDFAAGFNSPVDDALKGALDTARTRAVSIGGGVADLSKTKNERTVELFKSFFGGEGFNAFRRQAGEEPYRVAQSTLQDVDGVKLNEDLTTAVTGQLAEFGITANSGPKTLTQEQLDRVKQVAIDSLKKDIPNFASLPTDVQQAFLDSYTKGLPDAIAAYTTGKPVTGDQALAFASQAIAGASSVKDQVGGLNRNESLGTDAALTQLQGDRQQLVDALNGEVAGAGDVEQIRKFKLSIQQTDIAINGYIEDQISQSEAKIDAAVTSNQSRFGINNQVARSQVALEGLAAKLKNPNLTDAQRTALQAQYNDAAQQQKFSVVEAAAANTQGGLSAGNGAAQLQAQLDLVQAQKALNAPKQIATQRLVQNDAAKARTAALGALGLGALAAGANLASGDASFVTDYTLEPESEAFGQNKVQEQQLLQQQRQLALQTQADQAAAAAGRNKQQALSAATADANRRLVDAQSFGDPDDVAKAQLALTNANDAEVQYSLDLNFALAKNKHPRNQTALLQDAVNDARARLADAQAGGDPAAVAAALAAVDAADDAVIERALSNRSSARNAATNPLDTNTATRNAVADAQERLARVTQNPGEFDQGAIDDARAAANKANSDAAQYQLQLQAAQRSAAVSPGDRLGRAAAAVENTRASLNYYIQNNLQNTVEFFNLQAQLQQDLYDFAQTQEEVVAATARRTGVDLTDPIVNARIALEDLIAKQNLATTAAEKAAIQPDIDKARSDQAIAVIDKKTSDIQDSHDLKQITDAEYINQLQAEYDTIQAQLAAMDKNATGYEALRQKGIDIAKLLNGAAEALNSEFNLNGVALPTVYEVRRAVGASASDIRSQVVDYSSTNSQVVINGADMTQVIAYINQALGTGSTAVYTTSPRRTV